MFGVCLKGCPVFFCKKNTILLVSKMFLIGRPVFSFKKGLCSRMFGVLKVVLYGSYRFLLRLFSLVGLRLCGW